MEQFKVILLDTHTWVWFVSNPELLSEGALEKINIGVQEKSILISSISVWEVALLVKRQRLVLTIELENWISMSENLPFFSFVPIDNDIAVKSVQLPPPLHNDPADRIIIATAIKTGATLISKDEKILGYPGVKSFW